MKKIILLTFIFISLQATAQKSFFALNAGINVANQRVVYSATSFNSGPGPEFFQNITKPTFGFYYQRNFWNQLDIRLGAQYMGLGHQFQQNGLRYTQPDVNINYLTFPLSAVYLANKSLSLHAGPYLSFKLNSNTSGYHANDTGFMIGAEQNVYKNFSLDATYVIGTKNIWLDDQGGMIKYNNRALQFTLIYKFKKNS